MIYAHWTDEVGEVATFCYETEEQMNKKLQDLANGIGRVVKVTFRKYEHTKEQKRTYEPQAKKGN